MFSVWEIGSYPCSQRLCWVGVHQNGLTRCRTPSPTGVESSLVCRQDDHSRICARTELQRAKFTRVLTQGGKHPHKHAPAMNNRTSNKQAALSLKQGKNKIRKKNNVGVKHCWQELAWVRWGGPVRKNFCVLREGTGGNPNGAIG